mgnify:CR=1 FL=1
MCAPDHIGQRIRAAQADVESAARAVRRLTLEHGSPNRFVATEVGDEAGLSPLRVGKAIWASSFGRLCAERGVAVAVYRDGGYTWVDVKLMWREGEAAE